ncbi:MAG: hypothetical protein KDD82_19330, partial [Planctomycetes bacterium]|nr:hypothetical protein [Planctomycetota bacterium]
MSDPRPTDDAREGGERDPRPPASPVPAPAAPAPAAQPAPEAARRITTWQDEAGEPGRDGVPGELPFDAE